MIKLTRNMYEILTLLFSKKNLNLNEIARMTGTSVMGVSKIVAKFRNANIIDIMKIGKAHAVNLKLIDDNLEIFSLAEKFNTQKFCETHSELSQFIKILREKTIADSILIFGSYASGEESTNSDIDLLIINPKRNAIKIINQTSVLINIETNPILVSENEFIIQAKKRHRLYTEILNGKRIIIKGEYNFWKIVLKTTQF